MRNRLFSLCPYFAMFPESFVETHVGALTKKGDWVFDPFCGRGTSILQSLLMDREAAGVDVNPVAYCISSAKARVPSLEAVAKRIDCLERGFLREGRRGLSSEAAALPRFFRYAYRRDTLAAVLFLRHALRWKRDGVDRFIAALALGSLHGETDKSASYLSNQMPRTISTKPGYSVRYWRSRRLQAPRRDVFALLRRRAAYRLLSPHPPRVGAVAMADAREAADVFPDLEGRVKLVITSPPYLDVTRYEEDQWLRLWFLGHGPTPTYGALSADDRRAGKEGYWDFLSEAWEGIAPLAARRCLLVCRLGAKGVPAKELTEGIYETVLLAFPRAYLASRPQVSKMKKRQTPTFQPDARGCLFEVDYVFSLT